MVDLNKLAAEIHEAAVKKGFWSVEDAENKHQAKMISELGEVVQADRAGIMYEVERDGAKPEGVVAELADFVMMAIDMYTHYECDFNAIREAIADYNGLKAAVKNTPAHMIALALSAYTVEFAKGEYDGSLANAIWLAVAWAEAQDYDLWKCIREKMEYNERDRAYLHGRLY